MEAVKQANVSTTIWEEIKNNLQSHFSLRSRSDWHSPLIHFNKATLCGVLVSDKSSNSWIYFLNVTELKPHTSPHAGTFSVDSSTISHSTKMLLLSQEEKNIGDQSHKWNHAADSCVYSIRPNVNRCVWIHDGIWQRTRHTDHRMSRRGWRKASWENIGSAVSELNGKDV